MFRGVVSVYQNNLDLVLAKILIKEWENSAQLTDYGIDYFEGGLCCCEELAPQYPTQPGVQADPRHGPLFYES